jgi:dynein heavy chain
LFDRSGRTFAAAFAKFGDLSYYAPIQRIGCYMDYTARLKKKHILDLIAYMKTAPNKISRSMLDDDMSGGTRDEKRNAEYLEHSLFLGVMPEEDGQALEIKEAEILHEEQLANLRIYDNVPPRLEEGSYDFKRIWSDALITQAELSIKRYLRYVDSSDLIRNEELSKFNTKWMQGSLNFIATHLLQAH